jgi:hypothetical protein
MIGFFVGCKSWERERTLCEIEVFCWLQVWGEEEGTRRKGVFMAREPIHPLFKELLPKILE